MWLVLHGGGSRTIWYLGSLRAIRRPDGRFSWALAHDSENRGALWLSVAARLQRGITGGRKGQQRAAVQGAAETTVGVAVSG